jgi:hypothetical protein
VREYVRTCVCVRFSARMDFTHSRITSAWYAFRSLLLQWPCPLYRLCTHTHTHTRTHTHTYFAACIAAESSVTREPSLMHRSRTGVRLPYAVSRISVTASHFYTDLQLCLRPRHTDTLCNEWAPSCSPTKTYCSWHFSLAKRNMKAAGNI